MNLSLRRLALSAAILLPTFAFSQPDIRTERVQFEPGSTGTTVEGSIKGYEIVDYILRANEGQSMNASMATDNTASYFNILAPGEDNVAFFNGSISENQYEGALPATGDYKIRVYMMRSAARREEVANYRLEVNIAGVHHHESHDATVPGTNYHATGIISCAMSEGQPMGDCEFGVRRQGDGSGIVTVTRPDGSTLWVVYENGEVISAGGDETFSDRQDGASFEARRESDLVYLSVGGERYEIPDAVIFGG